MAAILLLRVDFVARLPMYAIGLCKETRPLRIPPLLATKPTKASHTGAHHTSANR